MAEKGLETKMPQILSKSLTYESCNSSSGHEQQVRHTPDPRLDTAVALDEESLDN